jgi:hypothetical protein
MNLGNYGTNQNDGGALRPSRLALPSRAVLFRMIGNCCTRHKITFNDPADQILATIKSCDYDKLVDLAFFAISDVGDEDHHKTIFIDRCSELGLK